MMVNRTLLKKFERVAIARNHDLAKRLRPGLSEAQVKRALTRAEVTGNIAPIVALYTWRDGTDLAFESAPGKTPNYELEKTKRSFFPGRPYFFLPLELAVGHFDHLKAAAVNHPQLSEGVGRYFPLFWDGSTNWLAIDVKKARRNRIILIAHRSDHPFFAAYNSFEEFIADAIRANQEGKPLLCFQKHTD